MMIICFRCLEQLNSASNRSLVRAHVSYLRMRSFFRSFWAFWLFSRFITRLKDSHNCNVDQCLLGKRTAPTKSSLWATLHYHMLTNNTRFKNQDNPQTPKISLTYLSFVRIPNINTIIISTDSNRLSYKAMIHVRGEVQLL